MQYPAFSEAFPPSFGASCPCSHHFLCTFYPAFSGVVSVSTSSIRQSCRSRPRCRCCSCPFRWSRNLDQVVRCGFALRFLGLPSSNGPSLVEACIVGTRRLAVGQVRSKILVQFVMRGYLSDWQTCLEIFRRTLYLRFVHRLAGLIRSFHQNFSPSTGWQDPPWMVSAIFTHDLLAMFAVLGCPFLLMYSFPPSV